MRLSLSVSIFFMCTAKSSSWVALLCWGRDFEGSLGRPSSLASVARDEYGTCWSGIPGRVENLDGWGNGHPCDVACGPHATAVVLLPWVGLDEEEWEEEQAYLAEQRQREIEERAAKEELDASVSWVKERAQADSCPAEQVSPRCTVARAWPHTMPTRLHSDIVRPMKCFVCGHERAQHRKPCRG